MAHELLLDGHLPAAEMVHGILTKMSGGAAGVICGNIQDLCRELNFSDELVRDTLETLWADGTIDDLNMIDHGTFSLSLNVVKPDFGKKDIAKTTETAERESWWKFFKRKKT